MNSHNLLLLSHANRVLATMAECGFPGVICGGFARDVHYNRNAKDIDIAVGSAEFSVSDLADLVDVLDRQYSVRAYWSDDKNPDARDPEATASCVSDEEHCVQLVIQIPALRLDIVVYDTEHEAGNLVAQHDCNLNQFALTGTTPVFLGAFHPDHHGLRVTREGVHPARVSYMEQKWDDIQFGGRKADINYAIPFC